MLSPPSEAVSKVHIGSPWQQGSNTDALTNVVLGPLTAVFFFHTLCPARVTPWAMALRGWWYQAARVELESGNWGFGNDYREMLQ